VQSLNGRVAVVTGATSGIGRFVAMGLAAQKATVIAVGRGEGRAVQAAAEISQATGNANVFPLAVKDLALRSEVQRVASTLIDKYPRIHLLVNNAGAYFHRREVTAEGLERTFALNVLAPFMLTSLLLTRLTESSPARVVQVSSAAHQGQSVDFTDLQTARHYRGFKAYGRSKLELLLLTREFAHRFHGLAVTFNAVHPGFVASGFGRNNGGFVGRGIWTLSHLFGIRPRRAAEVVLRVALDPVFAERTGVYVTRGGIRPGSRASQDMVSALRLFESVADLARRPP
jgi:retinol dehydrogenase 14